MSKPSLICLEKGPESIYTLPLLKMIKEAQQQHGLRHQDYQRYRTYCSSRLQRVRKVLNFVQGDRKQFKKKVNDYFSLQDYVQLFHYIFTKYYLVYFPYLHFYFHGT